MCSGYVILCFLSYFVNQRYAFIPSSNLLHKEKACFYPFSLLCMDGAMIFITSLVNYSSVRMRYDLYNSAISRKTLHQVQFTHSSATSIVSFLDHKIKLGHVQRVYLHAHDLSNNLQCALVIYLLSGLLLMLICLACT